MAESEPKTERQLIIDVVETARSDMSDQITLPSGVIDKYVEFKIEDARAEDRATIAQLERDKKRLEERNRTLLIELNSLNGELKRVEGEKSLIEGSYSNYQKQVLETLTEALGGLASKRVISTIEDSETTDTEHQS